MIVIATGTHALILGTPAERLAYRWACSEGEAHERAEEKLMALPAGAAARLLWYRDKDVRFLAARRLAAIGPEALPRVLAAWHDADAKERDGVWVAATYALALLGPAALPAAASEMAAGLGAKALSGGSKRDLMRALIEAGDPSPLVAAVRANPHDARDEAARALGWMGAVDAVAGLLDAPADPDVAAAAAAAAHHVLAHPATPEQPAGVPIDDRDRRWIPVDLVVSAPALVPRLCAAGRLEALAPLGTGAVVCARPLEERLAVHARLVAGVGTVEEATVLALLAREDPDPVVRRDALSLLVSWRPSPEPVVDAAVRLALADPSPLVAAMAVERAIARSIATREELTIAASSPDEKVRAAALRAKGEDGLAAALAAARQSTSQLVRADGVDALARHAPDPAALAEVIARAADGDPKVRVQAARALRAWAGGPAVARVVWDAPGQVHAVPEAPRPLGEACRPTVDAERDAVLRVLARLREDPSAEVAAAAAEVLRRAGYEGACP
ncbi:MAG: hypothetical protein ACOZNI_23535 [Myxococcota bacterium]